MSMPVERTRHHTLRARVSATRELGLHVRRLTLTAPEIGEPYATLGPDEYLGLVMPQTGRDLPELPRDAGTALRAALRGIDADVRPDLRWYTVRALRPERHELDVDVVVHGDDGPGSAWVTRAEVGDEVGLQSGSACYRVPGAAGHHVVVGDETAAPAIAAVLEAGAAEADVVRHVLIEAPDLSYLPEAELLRAHGALLLERGDAECGSAVLARLEELTLPGLAFGWACGEKRLASGVRRHLVRERGLDRRAVYFSSYWIEGRPRG